MAIILVFVHPERRPIILVLVLVFVTKIALLAANDFKPAGNNDGSFYFRTVQMFW